MTPELEQQYNDIISKAPASFRNKNSGFSQDLDHILQRADQIINEPDAQKAAQMAYNMVADMPNDTVGKIACKALFDRAAVQGGDASKLAAGVGNEILKAQLRGDLPGEFSVGSFARKNEAINGFNSQYFAQTSPGHVESIKKEVSDIAAAHGINAPKGELDVASSSAIGQAILDLSCKDHYTDVSKEYLASQKQVIQNYDGYDNRLVDATKSKLTPAEQILNPDPNYSPPEITPEMLQAEKNALAENFTSNNSALRLVSPAVATHDLAGAGKNVDWKAANGAVLQIINKFDQDKLDLGSDNAQQVGEKLFTDANKQKIAAMHQRLDGIQPDIPTLNLIDASKIGQEERQATRLAARPPEAPAQTQTPAQETESVRKPSVRDMLRGAASRVSDAASALKNTIGDKLERKGGEQKLSEVAPDKVEIYKSLQESVKQLQRMDGENAIDAALGDADAGQEFKEGATAQTIDKMKEEMAKMREQDPGLAQLDRSKVGQVVHSGVRDAAKSVGSKLKA